MALPDALQNAALRLPSAAARLAGVPGSGLPLDDEEAEQVEVMLRAVADAFGNDRDADGSSIVDALLADDPLRIALLRLVAFAVRCDQQRGPFSGVAACALAASAALLDLANPTASRTRTQLDFARKLLRMHTLQSCSRAFSAAVAAVAGAGEGPGGAAEVPAGPGGGGSEAGAALAAAGPQAQPTVMVRMLNNSCALVNSMLMSSIWDVDSAGSGMTARQLQQFNEQQQLYARELAAALRASSVLEHAARWALHLQLAEAGGRVLDGTMDNPLFNITLEFDYTDQLANLLDDGVAAPALLREALSGPCVRHLALSTGLAALCAADGGPSHGLPPELLLRLPILEGGGKGLRGGHALQQLDAWFFKVMMRALQGSTAAAATPPHDWRAVVGLLRRIGSLVLASARAWADEEAVGEAEAGVEALGDAEPPLQVVLPAADTMGVALPALHLFQRLLRDQDRAAAPVAPAALAEAEAAWWRLAVDVATHCARWASAGERSTLAELLRFPFWSLQFDGLLPAAPPPALSAALAGGLLPLWERLLRCVGRDPDCAEATLLTRMLLQTANPVGLWDLLAYGDLRQGAALVVTWGKLLRAVAVPQLIWSVGVEAASPLTERTALACGLVICTGRMLSLAIDRLAASSGWGAAEASVPQVQLTRLLSCAACDWLPPLARLVREGLPAVQRAVLTGQPIPDSVRQIQACAYDLLAWLRVLARCSGSGLAQAAEAAAESASASASTASAAAAGWRQLLLQEVGAVALLGAMCHHGGRSMHAMKCAALSYEEMTIGLPVLLSCCCCVAAACPAEVRQAVLAAAAEAAAAGASSGAGQGGGSGGGRQRGGRGTSGRGGRGRPSRAPAAPLPGWSPQLLRVLATECSGSCQGDERTAQVAAAASALARQAEQWVAGAGEDGAELAAAVAALSPEPHIDAAARALVPSPTEVRALLRTCANPACDNLAGDSEADLPLRACGRCGCAWYCRQECQAAHWRSGHREACGGRSVAAAGAVRVGQPASEASAP